MNDEDRKTEKRRDDALRRALQTPPKPKQESVKRKDERKGDKPRSVSQDPR